MEGHSEGGMEVEEMKSGQLLSSIKCFFFIDLSYCYGVTRDIMLHVSSQSE